MKIPEWINKWINKSQQFKVSLSFVDFEQNAAKMQFIGPPTVQRIILLWDKEAPAETKSVYFKKSEIFYFIITQKLQNQHSRHLTQPKPNVSRLG